MTLTIKIFSPTSKRTVLRFVILTKKLHITTLILYYAVCRNSMLTKGDPVSVITTVSSPLKARWSQSSVDLQRITKVNSGIIIHFFSKNRHWNVLVLYFNLCVRLNKLFQIYVYWNNILKWIYNMQYDFISPKRTVALTFCVQSIRLCEHVVWCILSFVWYDK